MGLVDRRKIRIERAFLDKAFHAEMGQVQDDGALGGGQRAAWLPAVDFRQGLGAKDDESVPFTCVGFLGAKTATSGEQQRSSLYQRSATLDVSTKHGACQGCIPDCNTTARSSSPA